MEFSDDELLDRCVQIIVDYSMTSFNASRIWNVFFMSLEEKRDNPIVMGRIHHLLINTGLVERVNDMFKRTPFFQTVVDKGGWIAYKNSLDKEEKDHLAEKMLQRQLSQSVIDTNEAISINNKNQSTSLRITTWLTLAIAIGTVLQGFGVIRSCIQSKESQVPITAPQIERIHPDTLSRIYNQIDELKDKLRSQDSAIKQSEQKIQVLQKYLGATR